MGAERFDFPGGDGQILSGRLERPVGPVRAHALLAHCFTCGKDSHAARRIARALAEQGVAVLRFDFTGVGDSEGAFGQTGLTGDVADLLAAAQALRKAGMPPALLIGHSLGGAAVLAAAGHLPEVTAVATIGAPFDPAHVQGLRGMAPPALTAHGDQAERIRHLRRALLILHAPRDPVVGVDNAEAIWRAARHPKSFVSLDDADHLLTRQADADYAAGVIAAWAMRYLPPLPSDPDALSRPAIAEPTEEGLLQTRVTTGGQAVLVDEPPALGGRGLGPSPYGLLTGALAACTAMTLRLYARRQGWPIPRVRVEVAHAKGPLGALPRDVFTRRIWLLDHPDDERRAALIQAADRCPVHLTLQSGARIQTQDADRPESG